MGASSGPNPAPGYQAPERTPLLDDSPPHPYETDLDRRWVHRAGLVGWLVWVGSTIALATWLGARGEWSWQVFVAACMGAVGVVRHVAPRSRVNARRLGKGLLIVGFLLLWVDADRLTPATAAFFIGLLGFSLAAALFSAQGRAQAAARAGGAALATWVGGVIWKVLERLA